jgi:hypothetical protein
MEKRIESTVISRHGNLINIYAVDNPLVRKEMLKPYSSYEIEYRFGANGSDTFIGEYIDCTSEMRSLIFTHPTKGEGRRIIVPTNNIIKLRHLFDK